jgi:hypothetical protein
MGEYRFNRRLVIISETAKKHRRPSRRPKEGPFINMPYQALPTSAPGSAFVLINVANIAETTIVVTSKNIQR